MSELGSAQLTNHEVVEALHHNSEFFINFFLAEEVKVPVPEFHVELMDLMIDSDTVEQLSLAVPRGHAKTTLAQLTAVHYFLFSDFSYILYMSSVAGHSVACCNTIVDFLESENFRRTFGEVVFQTKQEGKGFYEFTMPNGKQCILKAFGAGQKVRGTLIRKRRPELVIVDDLEDNDNIKTQELFNALEEWFLGPFYKCVDQFKSKWIWIGNMIKVESMLYKNSKSEFWHSRTYGCLLADGTPLWPDLWPLEKIRKDFLKYAERNKIGIWFAEMMNQPLAGENAIIDAEDIHYLPAAIPRENEIGFLTIDLAISDKEWAHKTVIAAHVWIADRECFQIAETRAFTGIDPISLFSEVISMGQVWGLYLVGIESVAYQAALQPVFEHLCLINRVEGFEFVGLPARQQKQFRIVAWASMVKSKDYALTEGDYHVTQQLLAYDPTKKENSDDTIDACAHGVTMINKYKYQIWNQKTLAEGREEHRQQNCYQVSRV